MARHKPWKLYFDLITGIVPIRACNGTVVRILNLTLPEINEKGAFENTSPGNLTGALNSLTLKRRIGGLRERHELALGSFHVALWL